MSSNFDRSLEIELRLPSTHPELLQGLDIWLHLGLISDAQVRQMALEYLVCRVVLQQQTTPEPQNVEMRYVASLQQQDNLPLAPQNKSVLARVLQSLGAELSVRWLLFLGMFLIVVSSGVLAASQWDKFPPYGQYGVLFAYTLSFWGIGFWAGRQSNLNLTTRALLIVTILLVPLNFWAMDSFQLWQNPINWIFIAIASVVLTAITALLCNTQLFVTDTQIRKLPLFNILGLSYLHWGWQLPGFPLIAIYLATVGTAIATVYQTLYSKNRDNPPTTRGDRVLLSSSVIIYALVALLVRAIFIVKVHVQQLGLAIGICGWLVIWLAQNLTPSPSPLEERGKVDEVRSNNVAFPLPILWELFGGALLFLGWLVSVDTTFPWQATVVSGLGLWFFNRRLQLGGTRADVGAIYVIGLETIWLFWRLVPSSLQQWVMDLATRLTHSQDAPWELLSVGLFPYVIIMLALADRLYRVNKVKLANFGELLTLLLGIVLTLLSLENPTLRSSNLLLSTIALWSFSQRRTPTRVHLVYMTQIVGVLTLCSIANRILPHLNQELWASLLLVIAIAEFFLSLGNGVWRRSAWHMGLGLAALSYTLLWENAYLAWISSSNGRENLGLIWLVIPMTFTGIASWGYRTQRTSISLSGTNILLSVATLGLAQLLTLPLAGSRLIGLAVATALMFVNTYYLRQKQYAVITVGFGLGAIAALLWEGVSTLPRLSGQGWFFVGAVTIASLWLVRKPLRQRNHELIEIYATAIDLWAIVLCSVELLLLSVHSLLVYQLITPGFWYLISCAIILVSIFYRHWQQPTPWGFYGIAWCLELLVAELCSFSEHSLTQIAIANITLGLITQLLGDWWQRRHRLEKLPTHWHILPLIYGVFGILLLHWQPFANSTGLLSLAVALIAIGVGRRHQQLKPLVYLGLVGVSVSAYELLLYQLSQVSGGAYGDGLIAMSVLGTSIMYAYRLLSPWLLNYLRITTQELKVVAHLHWVLSSCLLIAANFSPVEAKTLGLGTGLFLICYAVFQGRLRDEETRGQGDKENSLPLPLSSTWVYLGLLQVFCLRAYLPDAIVKLLEELLPWQAAIASIIAYFVYILPWDTWGWSKKPWRIAAYFLPPIFLWQTRMQVSPISILIAASFYVLIAKASNQVRFTYISIALINWALFRWFFSLNLTEGLWYIIPIGLSLLYVAQLDPQLKLPRMKACRHFLRLLGCGIICGWAIIFNQDSAVIPGIFSLIAIFVGLGLRIRAFLYVGVAAFFITSFYQLVLFSLQYPFFKWVVGLFVGIVLLTIAANFETRREQLNSLFRNTSEQLQEWE